MSPLLAELLRWTIGLALCGGIYYCMIAPDEHELAHKLLYPVMSLFLVYTVVVGAIYSDEDCERYYDLRGSIHTSCD